MDSVVHPSSDRDQYTNIFISETQFINYEAIKVGDVHLLLCLTVSYINFVQREWLQRSLTGLQQQVSHSQSIRCKNAILADIISFPLNFHFLICCVGN